MPLARVHVYVEGLVQGVGYRFFTVRVARALGLRGFVRNLDDGRVEVVAEGDESSLRQLLEELSIGPSGADVEDLDVKWEKPTGDFKDFTILY